jgi:hypothetical protein
VVVVAVVSSLFAGYVVVIAPSLRPRRRLRMIAPFDFFVAMVGADVRCVFPVPAHLPVLPFRWTHPREGDSIFRAVVAARWNTRGGGLTTVALGRCGNQQE